MLCCSIANLAAEQTKTKDCMPEVPTDSVDVRHCLVEQRSTTYLKGCKKTQRLHSASPAKSIANKQSMCAVQELKQDITALSHPCKTSGRHGARFGMAYHQIVLWTPWKRQGPGARHATGRPQVPSLHTPARCAPLWPSQDWQCASGPAAAGLQGMALRLCWLRHYCSRCHCCCCSVLAAADTSAAGSPESRRCVPRPL